MPPLIGITAIPRPVQTMYGPAEAHTPTDALTSSVAAAGGVPVLLPVVPAEHAALQLRGLDELVLAGGQDVDPSTYGRPPEAAEAVDAPWFLAVQWHPELMGSVPRGQDLFDALARESAA